MARTKTPNPLTTGAIGAAGGALIGGATGILLSSKTTRQKVASRLKNLRDYAQEAVKAVNDMAVNQQMKKVRFAGVKGGRTKGRSSQKRNSQKS